MRRVFLLLIALCLLTACGQRRGADSRQPLSEHSHTLVSDGNVVEHEPVGYCGNTVTTVRYEPMGKGEQECWQQSFWGGDSVALTDMLRWLDYSAEPCRCLPEYYVQTEFSASEYGISLSEGYVRHEGGQCQLDAEQLRALTQLLKHVADDKTDDLCGYPKAEERPVFQ